MNKAEKLKQVRAIQQIVAGGLLPEPESVDWLCSVALDALEPPSKRLDTIDYEAVRARLYTALGATPRSKRVSAKWVRYLNGLVRSGYTQADMLAVVDYKCGQWLGTEWAKYLRLETLFDKNKFESYTLEVGQAAKPKPLPPSHKPYDPEA